MRREENPLKFRKQRNKIDVNVKMFVIFNKRFLLFFTVENEYTGYTRRDTRDILVIGEIISDDARVKCD